MSLKTFIHLEATEPIAGLEGVSSENENNYSYEALHKTQGSGTLVFLIFKIETKEVVDVVSFLNEKPCYKNERNFGEEVAKSRYWAEPVFINSRNPDEVMQEVSKILTNENLFSKQCTYIEDEILTNEILLAA